MNGSEATGEDQPACNAYVVLRQTYGDGSGKPYVIGVFSTEEAAQACVGRAYLRGEDYGQPVTIVQVMMDQDQPEA